MKPRKSPKLPRLGPGFVDLCKRKAGAHGHRNDKRRKTRSARERAALADR